MYKKLIINNHIFLEKVRKAFPEHEHAEKMRNMSLIEESSPR